VTTFLMITREGDHALGTLCRRLTECQQRLDDPAERGGSLRILMVEDKGASFIGRLYDLGIKGNPSQKGHLHPFCHFLAASLFEQFDKF